MEENKSEMTWTDSAGTESKIKAQRKRRTGIMAALLALILMLAGTFAWFYVTNAVNEFGGRRDGDNSAVLHDDFDEEGEEGVHNKDIYVENTGENAIFIRIRLDEYMEINEQSLIAGADKMDETTWMTHKPHGMDVVDCDEVFHDYWEWKMGGDPVEYVPGEQGTNGVVSRYASDGTDTLVAGKTGNAWTHNQQNTEVITLTQYMLLSDQFRANYEGWIIDEDGYAYWYEKLDPEAATGLLLDEVILTGIIPAGSEYYYAINVILETVDEDDLDAWLTGSRTSDGLNRPDKVGSQDMINYLKDISESYTKITNDMNSGPGPEADDYDIDNDGYLSSEEKSAFEEDTRRYNTVDKLEIAKDPDKTRYYAGERFDPDGMELKATYEDGHVEENITDGYDYDSDTLQGEAGDTVVITIAYKKATTTFDVLIITEDRAAADRVADTLIGDTVELGGEEWIVLKKENGAAELWKKKPLEEAMQYHSSIPNPGWTESDMYKYLNGDYLDDLSDEITDTLIPVTHATNAPNTTLANTQNPQSTEKVYLLSTEELTSYINAGVTDGKLDEADMAGLSATRYWLRSPYPYDDISAYNTAGSSGGRFYNNVYANALLVRPALTVKYEP